MSVVLSTREEAEQAQEKSAKHDSMVLRNDKFYRENHRSLIRMCNGKHVVVREAQLVGVYENAEEALARTLEIYAPGTFLIRQCILHPERIYV